MRRMAAVLRLALAALVLLGGFVATGWAEPVSQRYGVYLSRLDDFNIRGTSFSATFWLFTVSPDGADKTFKTLEFPNASRVEVTNQLSESVEGGSWLQQRVQGSFRHNWNLTHYPFTRQTLRIEIEATADASAVRLAPDVANTAFDKDIVIDGWRIESVRIVPVLKSYETSFGDPRLPPGAVSQYSRLNLEIVVEQTDPSAFLTMVITPVIAILITLITYLLFSRELGLLTARLSLLVGTIFAVVISMRSVATDLGSVTSINLLDVVHIAALIYTTIGIAAAVQTWWALKNDSDVDQTHRMSRWILWVSTGVLVLVLTLSFADAYFHPDERSEGRADSCCTQRSHGAGHDFASGTVLTGVHRGVAGT
jgi:hypothetical protein